MFINEDENRGGKSHLGPGPPLLRSEPAQDKPKQKQMVVSVEAMGFKQLHSDGARAGTSIVMLTGSHSSISTLTVERTRWDGRSPRSIQ